MQLHGTPKMLSFCTSCRENVQFYERDGLYYCTECDVQSETMQVMEYSQLDSQPSQTFSTPFSRSKLIKVSSAAKKRAEAREEAEEEQRRSWWTAEVFQFILKAQVETLINMGVTSSLREVVKSLWFTYLRNSQWAFVDEKVKKGLKSNGNGKEKSQSQKEKSGKKKLKKKPSSKQSSSSQDEWPNSKKRIDPIDRYMLSSSSLSQRSQLRLHHLLALLYIALRLLKEPILLSDLIRWAREGHLPFYATSELLPKHIEESFQTQESQIFSVARPSQLQFSKVLIGLSRILRVLGLPPVATSNLNLVTQRFIVWLNLPASFHHSTHRLLSLHRPRLDSTSNPSHFTLQLAQAEEAPSMAYIIVTLKLFLGLDDEKEVRMSEVGREVRSKLPVDSGEEPFIWDEWVAAQKLRSRHYLLPAHRLNADNTETKRDITTVIKRHVESFQLEAEKNHLYNYTRYKGKNLSEILQQPFQKLRKKDSDYGRDDDGTSKPTSFPYSLAGCVVQDKDTMPPDLQDRIQDPIPSTSTVDDNAVPASHPGNKGLCWLSKKELCLEDFRKLSTDYLVNLDKVCERHAITLETGKERPGKSKRPRKRKHKKVKRDSVENEKQLSQESLDGLSYEDWRERILLGEEIEPPSKAKDSGKRKRKRADKESAESKKQVRRDEMDEESHKEWKRRTMPEDGSSQRRSTCSQGDAKEDYGYVVYDTKGFLEMKRRHEEEGQESGSAGKRVFHKSYQWLLEHCAALVGMEWTDIHEAVMNLETSLFSCEEELESD